MMLESRLLKTLKKGETKAYIEAKPMITTIGTLYIAQDSYGFTLNTDVIDHGMILMLDGATNREYRVGSPVSIGVAGGEASQYITYESIIAGNSIFSTNVFDVTVDLGVKYGSTSAAVLGKTLLLTYDYLLQVKFNDLVDGDVWKLSPVTPGTAESFTFGLDELGISKIYLAAQIPSGSAHAVNVQMLITG